MTSSFVPTLRGALLCLLLVAAALPGRSAAANGPEAVVGAFHDVLLGVMRDAEALGYKGRYGKLAPAVKTGFHLPLMIQVATGSFWRDTAEAQRDRLIQAFSRLSIGTYASRFTGYSGQSFVTLGRRPGPQKTILVDTKIVNPDGDDVPLTYVTREIKGAWRIIDVLLDTGISELAVRRSEYRRILENQGIDGLIEILGNKASRLEIGG